MHLFKQIPYKWASKIKSSNVNRLQRYSEYESTRERCCGRDDFESARANRSSLQWHNDLYQNVYPLDFRLRRCTTKVCFGVAIPSTYVIWNTRGKEDDRTAQVRLITTRLANYSRAVNLWIIIRLKQNVVSAVLIRLSTVSKHCWKAVVFAEI